MKRESRRVIVGWFLGMTIVFLCLLTPAIGEDQNGQVVSSNQGITLQAFSLKQTYSSTGTKLNNPADFPLPSTPAPQSPLIQILPRNSFDNSMFKASLVLTVALNLGDYFSTREALRYPNLVEANPALVNITKNPYVFAGVKIVASALSVYLLAQAYKESKILGWVMSAAVNSLLTYAVINNYRAIQLAKR